MPQDVFLDLARACLYGPKRVQALREMGRHANELTGQHGGTRPSVVEPWCAAFLQCAVVYASSFQRDAAFLPELMRMVIEVVVGCGPHPKGGEWSAVLGKLGCAGKPVAADRVDLELVARAIYGTQAERLAALRQIAEKATASSRGPREKAWGSCLLQAAKLATAQVDAEGRAVLNEMVGEVLDTLTIAAPETQAWMALAGGLHVGVETVPVMADGAM